MSKDVKKRVELLKYLRVDLVGGILSFGFALVCLAYIDSIVVLYFIGFGLILLSCILFFLICSRINKYETMYPYEVL